MESIHPFVVTKSNSSQREIAIVMQDGIKVNANEMISILHSQMRSRIENEGCVGFAIVSDVNVIDRKTNERSDAVRVDIQYENELPVTCIVPYEFDGGEVITGEIDAEPGTENLFATKPSSMK